MAIKVLPYDDATIASWGNKTKYIQNKTNHGSYFFTLNKDPKNGWAVPFVTGHKYKIHFGMTGLDYEKLTIDASERWEASDKSIYLVHNFTDVRVKNVFTIGSGSSAYVMPNNTIKANPDEWTFGQNVIYNETAVRETHFIINGKNVSDDPYKE
jgi:hypothetical protein